MLRRREERGKMRLSFENYKKELPLDLLDLDCSARRQRKKVVVWK